jgi:hypothetical protein
VRNYVAVADRGHGRDRPPHAAADVGELLRINDRDCRSRDGNQIGRQQGAFDASSWSSAASSSGRSPGDGQLSLSSTASPKPATSEQGGRGDSEGGKPKVSPLDQHGGGGNRTRVRGSTDRTSTSLGCPLISPDGRSAAALPPGQPSCGLTPPAIGSPSAPARF